MTEFPSYDTTQDISINKVDRVVKRNKETTELLKELEEFDQKSKYDDAREIYNQIITQKPTTTDEIAMKNKFLLFKYEINNIVSLNGNEHFRIISRLSEELKNEDMNEIDQQEVYTLY